MSFVVFKYAVLLLCIWSTDHYRVATNQVTSYKNMIVISPTYLVSKTVSYIIIITTSYKTCILFKSDVQMLVPCMKKATY